MDNSSGKANKSAPKIMSIFLKEHMDMYYIKVMVNETPTCINKLAVTYSWKNISFKLKQVNSDVQKCKTFEVGDIDTGYTPLISKEDAKIIIEYIDQDKALKKDKYIITDVKPFASWWNLYFAKEDVGSQRSPVYQAEIPISRIEYYNDVNEKGRLSVYLTPHYFNNPNCVIKYKGMWKKPEKDHEYITFNLTAFQFPGVAKEKDVFITIQTDKERELKYYIWRNTDFYGNPEELKFEEAVDDKGTNSYYPNGYGVKSNESKPIQNQGNVKPFQGQVVSQAKIDENKINEQKKIEDLRKVAEELKKENIYLRGEISNHKFQDEQTRRHIEQLKEELNESKKILDNDKQKLGKLDKDLLKKENEINGLKSENLQLEITKEEIENALSKCQREITEKKDILTLIDQLASEHDIAYWENIFKNVKSIENYNRNIEENVAFKKSSEENEKFIYFQMIYKWYLENGKKWLENTSEALGSDESYEKQYGITAEKLKDLKFYRGLINDLFNNYNAIITKIVKDSASDDEIKRKIKDETVKLLNESDTKETLEGMARAIYKCRSAVVRPGSIYNLSYYLINLFFIYDDIKTGEEAF
jgi:hypothetical protein